MKAKHITTIVLCFLVWRAEAQQDTLYYDNPHEAIDYIMQNLSPTYYEGKLLERSLSDAKVAYEQAHGNYNQTHSAFTWLSLYSCVHYSYIDSTLTFSNDELIDKIKDFFIAQEKADGDELVQPFGLLLHQLNHFDSSVVYNGGISEQNNQLVANVPQQSLYEPVMIKSVALLELYGESGYTTGKLVYDGRFISTSDDITLNSMRIDVGSGFQDFGVQNPLIRYNRNADSLIAFLALDYTLDGVPTKDTLQFYLTTKTGNENKSLEKSVHRWDVKGIKYPDNTNPDLKYAIRYGCGNGTKIRRPVIIAPPYRPAVQPVWFNKYYKQFNFKSLISSLSEMGYDVIFIKETPGNRGIDHAGNILANFLKYINQLKKENYPNEDWENVVIGFSAGGQHWRWALKKLEYEHMTSGTPHHHTRLYIPFDSPHWGANVPMFAQATFKEFKQTGNIFAALAYGALTDAASKDMLMNHIIGSNLTQSGNNDFYMTPAPTSEKMLIDFQIKNSFNHQFTPLNDLRRSFPTFTRNIAISTGSNESDYETQYGLTPGMNLFSQNFGIPTLWGLKYMNREINASWYLSGSSVLYRNDIRMILFVIPVITQHRYLTNWAYEWDMAQGGYKDDFFNHPGYSPVAIMRWGSYGLGTTHYTNSHMSFLPMVSALGINPTIWQNNNLYYNLKNEGLMYNIFNFNPNTDKSNTFGYPNLGHPTGHFNITPFEAIYCDPQTYEHIKMQKSVDDNGLDDNYLVYTRDFILNEVEADVVYLQNKIIGKNHVQWDPNYRYKAWYKAKDKIIFGSHVTPKTDPGKYIIEKTGEITAYACNEIILEPGFEAEYGSRFEAYIHCDNCDRPREKTTDNNHGNEKQAEQTQRNPELFSQDKLNEPSEAALKVYPNPSDGTFTIQFPDSDGGAYRIYELNGKQLLQERVEPGAKQKNVTLPKGMYLIRWKGNKKIFTQKVVVL